MPIERSVGKAEAAAPQLDGFEVTKVLGRTMLSDLYLARRKPLGDEPVVLKVLRNSVDPEERVLFEQGNALFSRYRHPNLCRVLARGTFRDNRPWAAFPFYSKGNLEDAGPYAEDDALRIGVQIADILHLLHEQGVLHRDVKPANILLDRGREPVLTDPNIAGHMHEHTDSVTTHLLSKAYAAPEVSALGRYDVRSEVFSLGKTLVALTVDPSPPVTALLERMCDPDPERRPASCAQVAQSLRDLERALDLPVTVSVAPLAIGDELTTSAPLGRARVRRAVYGGALIAAAALAASVIFWPTPSATPGLPSQSEEPFLREDFDGNALDVDRWLPPSSPAHLFAGDRVLNMLGSTSSETVDTDLVPRAMNGFREIDFTTAATSVSKPDVGGGSLVVEEQGGRTHKLVFGPSPGNPPTLVIAALVCARVSCSSYDDYVPPPQTRPFETYVLGEQVPMRVVDTGSEIEFWARDVVIARAAHTQPLKTFRFNAYAAPGESWHLTVDGVRVYS